MEENLWRKHFCLYNDDKCSNKLILILHNFSALWMSTSFVLTPEKRRFFCLLLKHFRIPIVAEYVFNYSHGSPNKRLKVYVWTEEKQKNYLILLSKQ